MKNVIMKILACMVLLGGLGLMAYPIAGNLLFEYNQGIAVKYYEEWAASLPEKERSSLLEECDEYNRALLERGAFLTDPFSSEESDSDSSLYDSLLNIKGDGTMGIVEVPGITGKLVIYHSDEEDVLQKGVGHVQGSSMPVGGTGTHAVLLAHTGLSSKKLFTNLDQVKEGEVFYLYILGETLAYQVDQIKVVLPTELDDLRIDPDEDYVTLLTCTPYGVNSHRLLVRGTRIPYEEAELIENEQQNSGSTWSSMYIKAIIAGMALALALGLISKLLGRIRKSNGFKKFK